MPESSQPVDTSESVHTQPWDGRTGPAVTLPATGVRFTIERLHAQGGLGQVSLALDGQLKRPVALKEIRPDRRNDEARRRFVNEAEITGQLEHPGIVPIYALETDAGGEPYYAMRFIQGRPMSDAIRQYHQATTVLAFRDLLQRFVSVCQTMAYAHSRGVVHRDLKPANVMLGEYGETLIVDWGLAKRMVGTSPAADPLCSTAAEQGDKEGCLSLQESPAPTLPTPSEVTQPGQALGTPAYMAPEQARGEWERVGLAADIFSLGAVLYELLTNQRPLQGKDVIEVVDNARAGHFAPPRKVKADVPKPLEAICLKAMAFTPEERYATAKELAADVEHWLADEAVSAYGEPWPVRTGRWMRKHRGLTAGAVVLVGSVVVILAVVVFLLDHARMRVEAEQARTARERDDARENFALARDAVDNTVTKVAENQLLKEGNFDQLRRELLALAVPFYEKFVEKHSADPDLEDDRGRAYHRLAFVRAELGEDSAAIDNYQSMRTIFAKLAADFPSRPEFRQQLAMSHINLGLLLRATGRLKEAESAYSDARAIYKQLVAEFPTRPEFRHGLAISHNSLGNLLRDTGRLQEAEAAYREAQAVQKQLVAEFPTRPEFRQELAKSHNNLGNLLSDTDRMQEAESAYGAALAIRKQLAAEFPTRPEFRQDLAKSHNTLGLVLYDTGRLQEAESAHSDAVALQKQLVAEFPTRPLFREQLAQSHNNLGVLLYNTGRLQEAGVAYGEAMAIYKQLATAFPTRPEFRRQLALSHNNLGIVLFGTGRLQEAELAYGDALAIYKQLAADFPTRSEFRQELATSHINLGLLLCATGRLKEAESAYCDALALQKQLVADFPNQPDIRNGLAVVCLNLARLCNQRRDFQAAKGYVEEAQPHHQAALKANPRHPGYRQFCSNNLGALVMANAGLLDQAAAVRSAERIRDLSWDPPANAYDAACTLSQCIPIVEQADQLDAAKRKAAMQFYGDQAMAMLRDAIAKGYKDVEHLKKDDDLKPLREREDFKKVVKELEEKK